MCSAVHPLALASPFFRQFNLPARGVEFRTPEVAFAHPLPSQPAVLAWRDVARTAQELTESAREWRSTFEFYTRHLTEFTDLVLSDKRSIPTSLRTVAGARVAARFGRDLLQLIHRLDQRGQALFAGAASHAIGPVPGLATSAVGLYLTALAHGTGWPIPVGGSQSIADAFIADFHVHGGTTATNWRVRTLYDLPPAKTYLLDVTPAALIRMFPNLPTPIRQTMRRYPHGGAAAKVDFVLSDHVPWTDRRVGSASTIHLGGKMAQIRTAEADVARGRLPYEPVVLVNNPTVVDDTRRAGRLRPLWTYAHVPYRCSTDVTELVIRRIEQVAPGFRDVIVESRCCPASQMGGHNANLFGGDIAVGRVSPYRIVARPGARLDPYAVGVPGVYLCSAATPPGPGVHGMSGYFAAKRLLAREFGLPLPVLWP